MVIIIIMIIIIIIIIIITIKATVSDRVRALVINR